MGRFFRRLAGGVFCLLCLFLVQPEDARAVPETPYDPALLLWYHAIPPQQQELLDLLYQGARTGAETVELPTGTQYADVSAALEVLLLDFPELYWLDRYYSIMYYQQAPELAVQVTLRYTGRAGDGAAFDAAQALADAAQGSDWDKALALHDALCAQAAYVEGSQAHNAAGALVTGEAVCDGYAAAYTLLCRLAGVRCGMISGEAVDNTGVSQPHAWNLVDTGEGAMLVDVTWDDQPSRLSHAYFGMTEELATMYTEGVGLLRPRCDQIALNWHVRQGCALPALEEAALRAWWEEQLLHLARERSMLEIRFLDGNTYALFTQNREAWLEALNQRVGAAGLYGRWRSWEIADQQVYGLEILP